MTSPQYSEYNPKRIDLDAVGTIKIDDYITSDLLRKHLFGIIIQDPDTGKKLAESVYNNLITYAVSYAEKVLGIVILPRIVAREKHDYYQNDFISNNYIRTYYKPIVQVEQISLSTQVNSGRYNAPPRDWRVYHTTGEIEVYWNMLGNNGYGQANGMSQNFASLQTQLVMGGFLNGMYDNYAPTNYAPQFTSVTYVAGMLPHIPRKDSEGNDLDIGRTYPWEMPPLLQELIASYAERKLLEIGGDLVLKAGISSIENSVDDISQVINTTQSPAYGGYGARMEQLENNIKNIVATLKSVYGTDNTVV